METIHIILAVILALLEIINAILEINDHKATLRRWAKKVIKRIHGFF